MLRRIRKPAGPAPALFDRAEMRWLQIESRSRLAFDQAISLSESRFHFSGSCFSGPSYATYIREPQYRDSCFALCGHNHRKATGQFKSSLRTAISRLLQSRQEFEIVPLMLSPSRAAVERGQQRK
jgi:hypothetical protein